MIASVSSPRGNFGWSTKGNLGSNVSTRTQGGKVGTNVSTIQKNDDAKLSEQQFLFKGESSCASAPPQKNESNNKADRGIIPQLSEDERLPAPPLPTGSLKPEPVPEAARAQPIPLLKMLMPLAMVVAVIAMVGLLVISGGALNPMMLTLPLMMGMSLLMMFSPAPGEDTAEMRRTYLRHLVALREKAIENADAQRAHELYRHPLTDELWSIVGTERMWERLGDASDALEVRIGTGSTALCTPFEISDSGATEDLDPVCAVSLRSMVQSLSSVHDMPLIIQLQAFRVINILGDAAPDLARAIAAQLCFYHGPEAVGIGVWLQGRKQRVFIQMLRRVGLLSNGFRITENHKTHNIKFSLWTAQVRKPPN